MPLTYNTQQVLSWDELLESINNGASHPDETQWAIYRYLKENYKNEGSVMSRTLLAAYMKLHVNEPSLINSLMLGIAAKVSEEYPDFRFPQFLKAWGYKGNLRNQDKERQTSKDGRTYLALVERVERALQSYLLHHPEEEREDSNLIVSMYAVISIESAQNSVEIVLHVYKLKEGWDVNNLFTIIPLNAAKSDILALQTIGRGLRLPFGAITGNEAIDTLDIVAHDHYREIVEDIKNSDTFKYRDLDDRGVEPTKVVEITNGIGDGQLSLLDDIFVSAGVKSFNDVCDVKTQDKMYEEYMKSFGRTKKPEKQVPPQYSIFDYIDEDGNEKTVETTTHTEEGSSLGVEKAQPMKKEDFVATVTELSRKAISVPKILVQPSSTVTLKPFVVKRNIADFEIAASKIERFNAVNAEMLESFDAEILAVDDAVNTLACMLLDCDALSEISVDEDADYILNIVQQYLALIDGSEADKNKIVRRYAKLIIDDIVKQIHENMDRQTYYTHVVQKDLIVFRKAVRNVRADGGEVNFRKTIANKNEIKKYVFTGYKKSYYNINAFDSDTERLVSVILEDDKDVIRWIKPPLNQLGLFWQAGQQYNPDFLVETPTAKYMIEVKAKNEVKNPDVVGKAKEGIKWCKYASIVDFDKKPWEYKLITDEVISVGNTLKYILGLSEVIDTEE